MAFGEVVELQCKDLKSRGIAEETVLTWYTVPAYKRLVEESDWDGAGWSCAFKTCSILTLSSHSVGSESIEV
jgi:hypothetical protein